MAKYGSGNNSHLNRQLQAGGSPTTSGTLPDWRHENTNHAGPARQPAPREASSNSSSAHQSQTTTDQSAANGPLLGQRIRLGKESYVIKGDLICSNHHLLAIESNTEMDAYQGVCPLCSTRHVLLEDRRGYYALADNIDKALQTQKLDAEKARGPPSLTDLRHYVEPCAPLNEIITGRNKGIEGDSNSCYMDATIFCMFAYNNVFDTLLYKQTDGKLARLQEILRDYVVHVLRSNEGFVQRHAMHYLRLELSKVTNDQAFIDREKDPSDFLKAIEKLFDYEPIKTIHPSEAPKSNLSNVTTNIVWEMFDMNPQQLLSTSIAAMFRNSLAEIPVRLVSVPPVLVLIAPRHERSRRSYRYIIPDRQIALDNDSLQLCCRSCDKTNPRSEATSDFYSCDVCQSRTSASSTEAIIQCYCSGCMKKKHDNLSTATLREHQVKKVDVKKHKLNLFAVLCIETSHYVAFVKCKTRQNGERWLFFDSMSDRINNQTNIPSVDRVVDFDRWLDVAERDEYFFEDLEKIVRDSRPTSQKFNEDQMRRLRLFRDGAFFFYENAAADY